MSADGGAAKPGEQVEGNVVEMKREPAAPSPTTPATTPETPPATAVATAPKRNRRRYLIMAIVPVLLAAIGGYYWLTGGRYASTDNAYLKQDRVTMAADVSGRIVEAAVRENDTVARGQLLFRIDPEPYRLTLAGAEAALASARLGVEQLRATYEQAIAEEKAAADDVGFKQKAYDRQKGLLAKGVTSQATFDGAENDLHAAQQALSQASQRKQSALAALGGDAGVATDSHPTVLAAIAKRDEAQRDLDNTEIKAPSAGVISQADRVQVGQYITAATPVVSLIETADSWVEANFKETDLANMVVGEKATITLDAYPGRTFEGEVASIGAGTGAEFAILPAQNATGNWVKVVQRVPVRIRFTDPTGAVPLRVGLSASVSVDTESGPRAAGLVSSPAAAATKTP